MGLNGRKCRGGFTLIEILLVVAILGILAAIVGIRTVGQTDKVRRKATWAQAANIKAAISQFEMDIGRLPKNLEELVEEGDANWPGPYLDSEEVPNDGWGHAFKMEKVGKRIRVTSPGPDGEFGNDDDLWK